MTEVWITIGVLAVLTFAIKAAGPVVVGGRELSAPAVGVISLLAPAVLSALIVVGTFADGRDLVLDARAAGPGGRRGGDRVPRAAGGGRAGGRGHRGGGEGAGGGLGAHGGLVGPGRGRDRTADRHAASCPAAVTPRTDPYGSRPVRAIRANTLALGRSVRRSVTGSYEKKPNFG